MCSDLGPDLRPGGYEMETAPTHELIAKAGKAIFKKVDVSSPHDVEELVASAVAEYGRLDMYVQVTPAPLSVGAIKVGIVC